MTITGIGATSRAIVHHGDVLDILPTLPAESVDAVVTDPPYELGFMGRAWDASGIAYNVELWRECLRMLKPGGHLLAFGGTRTSHRLTCAIEDAGFEIRDEIAWLYGSGFPKSLDVSKAIDKAAGAEREVIGPVPYTRGRAGQSYSETRRVSYDYDPQPVTAPATDDAKRWAGWGTALKPAHEPVVVARKPLVGTVAGNVLAHGTGALNIDATRVGRADGDRSEYGRDSHLPHANTTASLGRFAEVTPYSPHDAGRWPTNVVMTHAATPDGIDLCGDGCVPGCPVAELDAQSGITKDGVAVHRNRPGGKYQAPSAFGEYGNDARADIGYGGSGGASRFFPVFRYQAKAPTRERPKVNGVAHSTVKPLELMRWLVRLVTQPGGIVLEPFAGSGTTVEACALEGMHCIGIEQEATYLPLIEQRMTRAGLVLNPHLTRH